MVVSERARKQKKSTKDATRQQQQQQHTQGRQRLVTCFLLISLFLQILSNWPSSSNQSVRRAFLNYITTGPVGEDQGLVNITNAISQSAPNRTLVILMGPLRGGEPSWKSLYQHVLDVNHADLALAVPRQQKQLLQQSSLYLRARYVWEFDDHDDWTVAIDSIVNNNTKNDNKDNTSMLWHKLLDVRQDATTLGGCRGILGRGCQNLWMKWFVARQLKAHKLLERYDQFVVTRSDHYYVCDHDVSGLNPDLVWIPEGSDRGGYNNQHLVVSSTKIMQVLDILSTILNDPDDYILPLSGYGGSNPERFLQYIWHESHIYPQRVPRVMFAARSAHDFGTKKQPKEGDYHQSQAEYLKAKATCRHQETEHQRKNPQQNNVTNKVTTIAQDRRARRTQPEKVKKALYEMNIQLFGGNDAAKQ